MVAPLKLLSSTILFLLCTNAIHARSLDNGIQQLKKVKKAQPTPSKQSAGKFGISYFGGRLLTSPITVNFIIYGSKWTANVTAYSSAFVDFVNSAKTSTPKGKIPNVNQWWSILRTYTDSKKLPVSSSISVGSTITDLNSQGVAGLTDLSLQAIVRDALVKGTLKPNNFAINVVVTDSTVTFKNGFCKTGCGSHGSFAYTKFDIVYAHVGNPELQCPSLCMPQFIFPQKGIYWQPPNKNAGLDAMVNVLAHELASSSNDPNPNRLPVAKAGYYDGTQGPFKGYESVDFCAYDYGIVQLISVSKAPVIRSTAYNNFDCCSRGKSKGYHQPSIFLMKIKIIQVLIKA